MAQQLKDIKFGTKVMNEGEVSDAILTSSNGTIAPNFSSTSEYVKGMGVLYNGKLYFCTSESPIIGEWNPNNWEEKVITSAVSGNTYDFSSMSSIYKGLKDLLTVFGGQVSNYPQI